MSAPRLWSFFSTTFAIVAVFVPVGFMGGIIGKFFFQFGLTVTAAVLISMFVSFTLDPMLSSRMLRKTDKHNAVFRGMEAAFHAAGASGYFPMELDLHVLVAAIAAALP